MNRLYRAQNFLHKPWKEKINNIQFRLKPLLNRLLPGVPLLIHLPYGGWWFATDDTISKSIFTSGFEDAEWRFVDNFLKEGMTVLDIGAHHGFYTILAAKKVGSTGAVIAFEPSTRERRRLVWHLRINHCHNVKIEPVALAYQDGEAPLFIVGGRRTAFNSLRPPAVSEPTRKITVNTMTLDHYLQKEGIHHIDFIKIDAEGAELEILEGARELLNQAPSPVLMVEVSDIRTEPWGYPSSAIFHFLADRGYRWFSIGPEGRLQPSEERGSLYNFVAVPQKKLAEVGELIDPIGHSRDQYRVINAIPTG